MRAHVLAKQGAECNQAVSEVVLPNGMSRMTDDMWNVSHAEAKLLQLLLQPSEVQPVPAQSDNAGSCHWLVPFRDAAWCSYRMCYSAVVHKHV